jgi:putative flippase GtrA
VAALGVSVQPLTSRDGHEHRGNPGYPAFRRRFGWGFRGTDATSNRVGQGRRRCCSKLNPMPEDRLARQYQRLVTVVTAPFTRYVSVGAVATLTHYATMILAVDVFHVVPTWGTVLGASFGSLVNYVLNYHFTFASSRGHRESLPRFALAALLVVILNGIAMKLFTAAGMHYLVAQLIATGGTLVLGFFLNKFWTFGK